MQSSTSHSNLYPFGWYVALLLISTQSWAACISGNCVNGQGTVTYGNGDRYVGEWKDGKVHGQGTYTAADDSIDRGRWANGSFLGRQENPPQSQAPERVADNQEPIEASIEMHPIFLAFKKYEEEYWELDKECVQLTPRGTMALINVVNCIWRKDQILMAHYGLDDLIYREAAERYSSIFSLAKPTSIQALGGNSQALIDAFVWNKITTAKDYLRLQEITIKRFLNGKGSINNK